MKKQYSTPQLNVQEMKLGVYGDYGNDGGNDDIRPVKIVDRFDINME